MWMDGSFVNGASCKFIIALQLNEQQYLFKKQAATWILFCPDRLSREKKVWVTFFVTGGGGFSNWRELKSDCRTCKYILFLIDNFKQTYFEVFLLSCSKRLHRESQLALPNSFRLIALCSNISYLEAQVSDVCKILMPHLMLQWQEMIFNCQACIPLLEGKHMIKRQLYSKPFV